MNQSYDCIVVGGGPAGATVSTLLAQHGRHVLVLEKGRFPRHHIGESLMPQTYWVFKRLGMLEQLKASDFTRKESVQFVPASGKDSQPFFFTDRDPNEWSTTWQVKRDRFDRMMLDNARRHGVEVREGATVKEVLFEGTRAVGVRAMIDGETRSIGCKVVIDATGVNALLSKQLNLREGEADLKNAAIYAYWRGAHRDKGRNAGATLVIHTPDKLGWFWSIPLEDDITSIGIVGKPQFLITGRGDDPMAILEEEIARTPGMSRRVEGAERISQAYVTSDFTYRSRRLAGDGWVLCGDAFGFLDPIYSSGVFLALKMGEMTADTIHDALKEDDLRGERLGRHGPIICRGMQLIRQLVYSFYDPGFSFGAFNREFPQYHDQIVRLLIGDVFDKDDFDEVFDCIRKRVRLPEPVPLEGSPTR